MSLPNKIFLIGFMGSGKSTIGRKLANKLSYTFYDLDKEIEHKEGSSIAEIFSKKGEQYFRKLESEVLSTLSNENQVIALGGGTPCYADNMEFINQTGTSIYLKYNAGILFSRLVKAKSQRPLLAGKTDEELKAFIEEKLTERELFYKQSEYIIESPNLTTEELLNLFQ